MRGIAAALRVALYALYMVIKNTTVSINRVKSELRDIVWAYLAI